MANNIRFVHTCKLIFVVESTNPNKPTHSEILNTITDLMNQAPEYLVDVDVIDTAKEEVQ